MKNKDKYDLRELANTLSYKNSGVVIKYDGKEIFYGDEITFIQNFKNILKWLEQDYSPLDEIERKYLRAVIKPFKSRVISIAKEEWGTTVDRIRVLVNSKNGADIVRLPTFEKGTMYKGMELDKEYSLEDLEI